MISPDLPITKSSEDILNRGSFANSLAQAITGYSGSSSFTIGLYGSWGSGKTSLLNMILESVECLDKNAVILRFNPWLCSDPKQLISQFFKQMASSIKMKKPAAAKAWELIDQYSAILDATSIIPVAGPAFAAVGKVLAKKAENTVAHEAADLQGKKDQIIQKLLEEKIKIIVTIDDIDRLSESEIISIFQLVKALADFPNTVYILSFDYDVVVRALGTVQHGDGKEYLEKIIQVPFEIPVPSISNIHDSLFAKLNGIIKDVPENRWDKTTWADLFQYGLKHYIKTIRDVIRFTNVFTLKFDLLKDETAPVDLLGLTALQVFEPSVYSQLPDNKEMLCGSDQIYAYDTRKAKEKIRKTIAGIIPADGIVTDHAAASNILGILFPKVKEAADSPFYLGRAYSHRDFLLNNNIAAPECFDRYFALTLEKEAIPTAAINRLIYESDENELDDDMKQLYGNGKIVRLLEEIEAHANHDGTEKISSERASLLLKALTRNWSSFEENDRNLFSIPFSWRLLLCAEPLLEKIEPEARISCIQSIFHDENVPPSVLALLLQRFENRLGRFTDDKSCSENTLIPLQNVLDLETIFITRARDAIETGAAFLQYQGLSFLWLLKQIDKKLAETIEKKIISDDVSLAKVISYCTAVSHTISASMIRMREINTESLKKYIDVDEAYRRMKSFTETNRFFSLPQNDQMNAIAFLLGMERPNMISRKECRITDDEIENALEQIKETNKRS